MTTIRTHKQANYSVIDNEPINDNRLSWGAKGILIYLLSKPDNWQIYAADLINHAPEGKSAVYARLKELETLGYLYRERKRNSEGKIYWESHIYESPAKNPNFDPSTVTDFPDMENPDMENPDTDNRILPNTEEPSTDKPNTEGPINDDDNRAAEIYQCYEQEIGILSPKIAEMVGEAIDSYPHQWILEAIGIAAKANVRKLNYILKVLDNWQTEGKNNGKPKPQKDKHIPPGLTPAKIARMRELDNEQ